MNLLPEESRNKDNSDKDNNNGEGVNLSKVVIASSVGTVAGMLIKELINHFNKNEE